MTDARRAAWPPEPQSPRVVRAWDERASAEYGIPSILLMENAGREAARILLELKARAPDTFRPPWWILAGGGNNGGDGLVVARHLDNAGEDVRIAIAFRPERLRDGADNTTNWRIVEKMGLRVMPPDEGLRPPRALANAREGVIVDALLGTGATPPIRPPLSDWLALVGRLDLPIVSLDLPSGLDAATGERDEHALAARHTTTFAAAKTGFYLRHGPELTGEVHVVDIGLPRALWERSADIGDGQ